MKFVLVVKLKEQPMKTLGPFETEAAAKDAMRRSVTYCNDEREIEWTKIEPVIRPDSVEELRFRLEKLLKSHDWFYQYSDDHRYWQNGQREWKEIERVGKFVPDFHELVEKHRPQVKS